MNYLQGRLTIDETYDGFKDFGVYVPNGGYIGVMTPPTFKTIPTTDWHEEDGVEVDLSNPVLGGRQFSLPLNVFSNRLADGLIKYLSNGAYHKWEFADLGMTMTLRYVGNASYMSERDKGTISLTMAEDNPPKYETQGDVPSVKLLTAFGVTGVRIDGVDLYQYGVRVIEGTIDSFRRHANFKENLKADLKGKIGVIYDANIAQFSTIDSTLNILIHTQKKSDFWVRYNALMNTFTMAGARTVYISRLNKSFPCYYKSASVQEFAVREEEVWCKMGVTLTVMNRPTDGAYLYTEQSRQWIADTNSNRIQPA